MPDSGKRTTGSVKAKFVTILAAAVAFFPWELRGEDGPCSRIEEGGAAYTVCAFDPGADDIRVFHADPSGSVFRDFASLRRHLWLDRHVLRFAMNGGMYHRDYSPVGLHVENGVEKAAVSTRAGWGNFHLLPNGVFALAGGEARVMETTAYLGSGFAPSHATQSGPMLVIDGALHPRFLPDSDSLKIRNGVGVDVAGRVVFVISEQPVRFYDFALLFRDRLGCDNALYLDGTISSVFIPQMRREDRIFPMGPIIAVVGRAPD